MARESFDDAEVAQILNTHFISIKVDREERPDIDSIYMKACQIMGGQGGWPLSVFITPDKKPFFAGTYFPKRGYGGMPGFIDILFSIASSWKNNREAVTLTANRVTNALMRRQPARSLTPRLLDAAYEDCTKRFDAAFGGFGQAPKFPVPHVLLFLMKYHKFAKAENNAMGMVVKTLDCMASGGFYDVIGYGFCRYATDREWHVPHYEKMLYDNALLSMAYAKAYAETGKERFAETAKNTLEYIETRLSAPEGGFFAAESAESEGVEGLYYFFTRKEIIKLLGEADGHVFCERWHIKNGDESVPYANAPINEADAALIKQHRPKLLEARNKRTPPARDEKILLSWNGLAIAAFALAGKLFSGGYIEAANNAVRRIEKDLRRVDGRMVSCYIDGASEILAFHDDYAYYLYGLVALYEATGDEGALSLAIEKADNMLELFWDNKLGGFLLNGKDVEEQILNPKDAYDNALPSGNSVAADVLIRLYGYTRNPMYKEKAEAVFRVFGEDVFLVPQGYAHLLGAYMDSLRG